MIEYLGVRNDFTDSRGSVNLMIRGDLSLSERCKIAIERPGQNRPYLTEDGWGSNYRKCLIDVITSAEGVVDLCLPAAFTRCLDPEHNYKVELFDLDDGSVGIFGMNWTPPARIRAMSAQAPAPAVFTPAEEVAEPEAEPQPVEPEAEHEPVMAPKPRLIQRTVRSCVRCGGQIFSTFVVCPYCGTPVSPD